MKKENVLSFVNICTMSNEKSNSPSIPPLCSNVKWRSTSLNEKRGENGMRMEILEMGVNQEWRIKTFVFAFTSAPN